MLCLWLGPLRFNCLISFAPLFGYAYCQVLVLVLSPFYELGVKIVRAGHLCVLVHVGCRGAICAAKKV